MRGRIQASLDPLEAQIEPLPRQQRMALLALGGQEPLSMGGLARRLGVTASSATELVDRLSERGLVERHHGQADRRAILVTLTPVAGAVLERVGRAVGSAAASLVASLEDRDLAALDALLDRVLARAEGGEAPA